MSSHPSYTGVRQALAGLPGSVGGGSRADLGDGYFFEVERFRVVAAQHRGGQQAGDERGAGTDHESHRVAVPEGLERERHGRAGSVTTSRDEPTSAARCPYHLVLPPGKGARRDFGGSRPVRRAVPPAGVRNPVIGAVTH
jgi:hypothetical protein